MKFPLCSINGEILPREAARASLFDVEFSYGFGVYENIRVSAGVAIFLRRHVERLLHSARVIGVEHRYTRAEIEGWVRSLVARVDAPAFNLKILLLGAKDPRDARLAILPLAPSFPDRKWYRDGVSVITVEHERFLPGAKTLNMLPSYLAYREAQGRGCYDALLVDQKGNLTEGTRTNLLALRGTTLLSPPVSHILEGVTRAGVLLAARERGWEIREEGIPLGAVGQYDGLILTSTSSKILPIRQVDTRPIPLAPTISEFQDAFDAFLERTAGIFPGDEE